ncbi:MAG: hypothetical protein ACR2P1_07840 [Pseudomonadales bacterium]
MMQYLSNVTTTRAIVTLFVSVMTLLGTSAVQAQEGWRFGIGTGLSSFSLDGDIGFATPGGGIVAEVDLDNSDTADLIESGLGFAGFAKTGPWTINLSVGTVALEDDDAQLLSAEWDKTQAELSVAYTFAETGNHAFGVLVGARYTEHEWDIETANSSISPEDDWTDGIVGLTHAVPFLETWSWSNRVDVGFGDTEEAVQATTAINWRPGAHWVLNLNLKYVSTEFGDEGDVGDADFYFYDVEEPAIGLGFMFTW